MQERDWKTFKAKYGSGLAYLVTEGDKHYLCILADGQGYFRFEVNLATLARLNVESAERILSAVHGGHAARMGAAPLEHKCIK